MSRPDTRKTLIDEGLKAFLANGYDGVGIGPVLAAAGVPKGSFYHFFRSKEEFAGAVLTAYADRYGRLRESILADKSRPPLQRLRHYFDELERELASEHPLGGCLYGVLTQTMATRSEALREPSSPVPSMPGRRACARFCVKLSKPATWPQTWMGAPPQPS